MKTVSVLLLLYCVVFVFSPCVSLAETTRAEKKRAANQAKRMARSLSVLAANGGGSLLRPDLESATVSERLAKWLKQNRAALVNAGPGPFLKPTKWGVASTSGNQLYLHVTGWPKTGKLVIPRLHNSVLTCKFTHNDQELELAPNVNAWEIALPQKPQQLLFPPIVELLLDRPPLLGQNEPPVVKPGDDKSIRLHSRYAVTHGQNLRFEPQSTKNTLGYWNKEDDWVEWAFEAPKGVDYEVVLRYGCGNGNGDSDIEITVGEQIIPFKVKPTGGFQNWKDVSLGTAREMNGITKLTVKVQEKAKTAVMDIQQITLKPLAE